MAITLRLIKGSELTHAELDGNFTELEALQSGGSTNSKTSTSGVLALDYSDKASTVTLTENITSVTFTGATSGAEKSINVYFTQDSTGARTVSSSTFLTEDGLGLSISSSGTSIVTFTTVDGGTTNYGFSAGSNWS